jgi:hypothetical protein
MFSKIFAVCCVSILVATDVAASIPPGIYRITNVLSHSLVRAYSEESPVFVSSTFENPGPFALFDIRDAENSSGYTIRNVGLNQYVSAAEETQGAPLFAKGPPEAFAVEQAGDGQFVIKIVNKDLVWTIAPPAIPKGNVILLPANGEQTQRFILTLLNPDLHQTAHSSAKFRVQEPAVENCGHKWSLYRPVEAMLQYLPYVGY